MLRVYYFFFLFWAIFGNDFDSQLGLSRDELDLKKFVEENHIETADSVAAPQNALQEAVENESDNSSVASADQSSSTEGGTTDDTPVEGDGAGPAAADVVAPVVVAVHHVISASSDGQSKCCKGATPQCMACQEGISIEIYCADNPVVGCPTQIAPETGDNPAEEEEKQPEPEKSQDRNSQDVNINIRVNALPIEQPGHKCTIDVAENNQACPRKAKCAAPEAVSARCGGKEWEVVKEIEDPASCCLKQCNFRCKAVTMPSYGQQSIINTNAMLPKDIPKENEMERLEYDQESKKVIKPVPKMNDKPKEKPKVAKESKTIYKKSEKKPKEEKKEKKILPASVTLELFDSTITDDSFTFSYTIANANPNGGFYWTVQRKSTGSLLASTVEKDGETKAPCSGYGKQSDASGVTNVDVDCPFVAGKTYLLWFALDLDTQGGGVFLSPGEPIAFEIPSEPLQRGPKVSTTMSAYSYSLMLNADKNSQPSHLTKLVNAMKEKSQENAPETAEESAPEPESVQPVMHIVTVDKREEAEEPKEAPEQPKEAEEQKEPAQSDEGAPMVVHHIHHVVHHIAGDSQEKESDNEEKPEEGEKKEEVKEEEKEEIKEKVKEAVKEKVKKAVTQAKADMKEEAKKEEQQKQEKIQENVKRAVKSAVTKAKETASNTKKVLKEAKKASEKMSKKVEESSDDDDNDDDDDDKKDLKKSLKDGAKQAKKLQDKAEKAHEKAKKAVEKAKEKVEKLGKDKAIFPPKAKDSEEPKPAPSDMEEDEDEARPKGKFKITKSTNGGLTLACKSCANKDGKLYYLMLHSKHHGQTRDGTHHVVTATSVYKAFLGDDQKDGETAVSGGMDLSDAEEFKIEHKFPEGDTYEIYLATDSDGKGKNLQLVGDAIEVKTPENELSAELTVTLNKWRKIFFAFFLTLIVGALILSYRQFFPPKHSYEKLLLDFEVYEDEF